MGEKDSFRSDTIYQRCSAFSGLDVKNIRLTKLPASPVPPVTPEDGTGVLHDLRAFAVHNFIM